MPKDTEDSGAQPKSHSSPKESNVSVGEIFFLETNDDEPTPNVTSKTKRENDLFNGNESHSKEENDEEIGEKNKRQRHTSQNSLPTTANTVPVFGITPPNFVSFEEIMKTANDMSRISLVNEIVFNKDFKLEKKDDSNELEKAVRENMKKAFWDILEEQLAESPPNFKQAISLLQEIKETLLLFLMPQHVQLKNEINEILDIDLIRQKVENGIFDFQRYAQYILSVCARLCCPVRDEMIQQLSEIKEIIPLFKGIFELLELMRLDFANFYIRQFRPHIQLASVEYEREKFKQMIEAHQKYQIDVLQFTRNWIKRNYESLDLSQENDMKVLFKKALIASYMDLLKCIHSPFNCFSNTTSTETENNEKEQKVLEDDFPETLLIIRNRIDNVREKILRVTLISSVFVVTFAAIGEPLQSIKDFRMSLKKQLEIIISSNEEKGSPSSKLQYLDQTKLKSILTSVGLQVIASIEQAYDKYYVAKENRSQNEEKLESLKYQISELSLPGNRIRSVMERRILEFIERVISSPSSLEVAPIQVPSGLSTFSTELVQIAGEFTRLVSYNRAVYSSYYTKIIADIAGPTHFISPGEVKAIEKSFYD